MKTKDGWYVHPQIDRGLDPIYVSGGQAWNWYARQLRTWPLSTIMDEFMESRPVASLYIKLINRYFEIPPSQEIPT